LVVLRDVTCLRLPRPSFSLSSRVFFLPWYTCFFVVLSNYSSFRSGYGSCSSTFPFSLSLSLSSYCLLPTFFYLASLPLKGGKDKSWPLKHQHQLKSPSFLPSLPPPSLPPQTFGPCFE
jgi:hypothetical protein